MKNDSQNLYISVESLRNRITSRLIPALFVALLISMFLSLARIPTMGFHVFMLLQIFLLVAMAILYAARKRIRSDASALVMVGILSLFLIFGVAALGLLSATFVIGPIISLYLMLLGHRRSAYTSMVVILVYLSVMAALFVSGVFESAAYPNLYVRSSIAWMLMITAVGGVSFAFVAPLELVHGVLEGSEERFRLAFENANVGICLTNLEGRLLKVNDTLCEMLGYNRDELEQMNFSDITYQDDKEISLQFVERAPSGGPSKINFEKRYLRKRGDIVWANVSSSLVCDSHGNPQNFITHIQNITERKRAEEALQASEERYRTLVTLSPDALYVHVGGKIALVNPAICRLLGAEDESQLLGKPVFDIVHPDYHDKLRERWNLIFGGQPAPPLEEKFVRLDGTLVEVEASAVAIDWQGSKGVQVIARDITERKRDEQVIRDSEKRFRTIFNQAPIAMALLDMQGHPVISNLPLSEMVGYTTEELSKMKFTDFTYAEDIDKDLNQFIELVEGKISKYSMEKRYVHKNGNLVWANLYVTILRDENGLPQDIIGMAEDITERKQVEDALRESEGRLRAMFESSRDAIGVSKKGVHIYANPSYLKLFGFENNESIIGTSIVDSIAPSHRQQMMENVEQRYAGKPVPKFYEARGMKVDGTEFDAEFNVSTYELHGEIYSLATIRDITERKKAEETLSLSMEQLHALTMRLENIREEERKSMSREVHDELGQILTAMRMDLMSLKKMEVTDITVIKTKLQAMLDLTAKAIKSVQDISARLRPGMLDDLGLAAAIEWQMEEFQERSGISCSLQLPDHDLEIGDERSTVLFRILQEALTNIVRHARAKNVAVNVVDLKNEIVMTILDDGIGISDESVRNPRSLGLLGIRERLHAFQGNCFIQRGANGGTEIRIQLPIKLS